MLRRYMPTAILCGRLGRGDIIGRITVGSLRNTALAAGERVHQPPPCLSDGWMEASTTTPRPGARSATLKLYDEVEVGSSDRLKTSSSKGDCIVDLASRRFLKSVCVARSPRRAKRAKLRQTQAWHPKCVCVAAARHNCDRHSRAFRDCCSAPCARTA